MGTNDPPNQPNHAAASDSSDRTLSTGGPGGAAAGQIGPYRMLQLLGEGGMGEVWLAEQKSPIRRTVALKLIKAGMDTKVVVARFESERQALALMHHPNIARVFDAGATPEGRPYFVMEYVPGLPLNEYCDKHRLTVNERLELFMQVCDGVQHAHQKAIIHRDLKPSNVLVVEQDNKPVPKIIDFGLAKATAQRLTDKTMFTELGVMMGTPEYMSPEQADQREQNIDTRTDVYSLGVILYQLMAGVLPIDVKALRAAGLEAILRTIREQDPPKLSTRIRGLGEASNVAASNRREEPRTFARHLQGELDWITMKALEKDRTRRYGSAAELGADIERHLHNEPVIAHPPSAAYRASKFVRRHRWAVAAAASAVVLLITFAAVTAVQARRIAAERDRASRQAEAAQRVASFMKGMFKVSDPSQARGNSITARELLDSASKEIDTGLAKDPETQAQLMDVMGEVYESLGLYPQAHPLFEHALDIQRRVKGPRNPETLRSADDLAWLLLDEGHYAEAEKLARETLDIQRQVLGQDDPDTLKSMRELAATLQRQGHYADAEKMEREELDIERRVLGPEHPDTLKTLNNLAGVLRDEGRYAEEEDTERKVLDVRRRLFGPEHPQTLITMNNLASTLENEKRYAEAESLDRQVIDIERRVLGPEHPETVRTLNDLAKALDDQGSYPEAEKMYRDVIDIRRRVLGPEHPNTLMAIMSLGAPLEQEGRYAEAEKLDRQVLEIQRRVLGPEHPDTAVTVYGLSCLAARQGHKDQALSLLRESVDHGLPPWGDLAVDKDPDLKSLHDDPRFATIVADAKERAAATQKPN
ncbi:MAG TPA: serine/threonine-protein kinase [Candidatus Acidoferrales bacterium]|nr:serine/threonine-protein kinase [Candidatus Acidoferrales bacterium]